MDTLDAMLVGGFIGFVFGSALSIGLYIWIDGPRGLIRGCRHEWIEDEVGHRNCSICMKHEMLYENPYPDVGEPKYEWK